MNIDDYLPKMLMIQENILSFLDNDENLDDQFQIFTDFLKTQNIQDQCFIEFLNLISKISENHYRKQNLIIKIEKILTFLKDDIKCHFTNISLFNIFRNNKRILLFLIENQFITIDYYIYSKLKNEINNLNYFKPELISFFTKKPVKIDPIFKENRRKGENQYEICKLIQKDSVEEFIIYVNKTNLNLSKTKINHSIFETNSFLQNNKVSLIEYAAFYGSIRIFNYLHLNKVDLTSSLWLFVIHSNNSELIQLLIDNHIYPKDISYFDCFKESIKCFHNDVAKFIKENLLENNNINESKLIDFYNFEFVPKDINNPKLLPSFCTFNYFSLVSLILNHIAVDKIKINKFHKVLLYNAVCNENIEIVQLLLKQNDININYRNILM